MLSHVCGMFKFLGSQHKYVRITDVAYLVLYMQSVSWWLKLLHSAKKFSQVTSYSVGISLNSPVWGWSGEMLQVSTFSEILYKTETSKSRSQHTQVTYQLLQSVLTCSTLPHTTSLINSCTWWLCDVHRKDSLALIYCFCMCRGRHSWFSAGLWKYMNIH